MLLTNQTATNECSQSEQTGSHRAQFTGLRNDRARRGSGCETGWGTSAPGFNEAFSPLSSVNSLSTRNSRYRSSDR